MSETKKSILLVDDHDLILQGIKYIVDQIPEINQLVQLLLQKKLVGVFPASLLIFIS